MGRDIATSIFGDNETIFIYLSRESVEMIKGRILRPFIAVEFKLYG